MNKAQQNSTNTIEEKFRELIDKIKELVNEEQEAYNNLPVNFQNSELGASMVDIIDNLGDIYILVDAYHRTMRTILRRLRGNG